MDDLLLTGWQHYIRLHHQGSVSQICNEEIGSASSQESQTAENQSIGIDFLGARITRGEDGTVWCDQSKYILHCMRENEFIDKEGQVVLRRASAPPAVDEKLGEEEGNIREKNDALIMCRKYIGQMMWLTTRTRPDIAACLGVLASLMVRRPQEVKNHLVQLVEILVDYKRPCHVHSTLP